MSSVQISSVSVMGSDPAGALEGRGSLGGLLGTDGRPGREGPGSVLGRLVEQPLAQQGVVLFQILYEVRLLLHHLLQTTALSGTHTTQGGS